jgi:hypothetical protein
MRNGDLKRWKLAGELVVPLVMVSFLGAYWWQAAGLSIGAISFPLALSGILVALLLIQLLLIVRDYRSAEPTAKEDVSAAPSKAVAKSGVRVEPVPYGVASTAIRRVAILALAAGLFLFWRELGGTIVIFAFTLGSLLILAERRLPILILLPAGLAIALTYLFKVVLRVRFPDGFLPIF